MKPSILAKTALVQPRSIVRVSNSRKKVSLAEMLCGTGEALAREARIVEIFRPQIWSRANWQLLQTCVCTRYCKASGLLRPPEPSVMGFRSLPRPPEASLMGFRGLSRPREASTKSQNPFSLQDYEASGTRAYNTIRGVPARPRARTNPGCLSSFM